MFRIDTATAAASLPAPGAAGTPGYFTNGNPTTGVPPTTISADFLNLVQEEIMSVLAAAGIAESKTATNQLLTALGALFLPLAGLSATLAVPGGITIGGLVLKWGLFTTSSSGFTNLRFTAFPTALLLPFGTQMGSTPAIYSPQFNLAGATSTTIPTAAIGTDSGYHACSIAYLLLGH